MIDPDTKQVDLIVDQEIHRRALRALRAQDDHDAIAEGIAQMEAGEARPAEEVFDSLPRQLGFPSES